MPTPTERRIIEERRAKKSGAILVPILERVLEQDINTGPSMPDDFRFMDMLIKARALPRRKGVFSPSMLGSCVRQAWFAKRGEKKILANSPQTNGYFLNGNFVHLKWQYAMWRAEQMGMLELVHVPIAHEVEILRELLVAKKLSNDDALAWRESLDFYGDGTRPGVEVRVIDKSGDFGGTIDVLAKIKKTHVIDFKGINLIDYQRTIKKGAKDEYRKQIVGYTDIVEDVLSIEDMGDPLLISESKAGPIGGSGSPIALHETEVSREKFRPEVTRRLKTLRWYDHRDEIPEPECVSTRHMMFQECAFNRHCLDEVKRAQKLHDAQLAKKRTRMKPARPSR